MPSVSPRSTLKLTPSTARYTPLRVWKYVRRSVTFRSGIGGYRVAARGGSKQVPDRAPYRLGGQAIQGGAPGRGAAMRLQDPVARGEDRPGTGGIGRAEE